MSDPRGYQAGTRAGLMVLSQGTCYWPNCKIPVFIYVDKKPVINVYFAHIRAAKNNGPRYVSNMTDDQRRDISNLILLCKGHHEAVDSDEKKYPIATLQQWKSSREHHGKSAIAGLNGLTEDRLKSMIVDAVEASEKKIDKALSHLATIDKEAATLLSELKRNSEIQRLQRPVIDPDSVSLLYSITKPLHEALNPDTIHQLYGSAVKLENIPSMIEQLNVILQDMRRMRDYM